MSDNDFINFGKHLSNFVNEYNKNNGTKYIADFKPSYVPEFVIQNQDDVRKIWDKYSYKFKYDKDWLFKKFRYDGVKFKITGVKPTEDTQCILAERCDYGKIYVFTVNKIKLSIFNNF